MLDPVVVYERTADALAAMIVPDFSDMDPESVEKAFMAAFTFGGADPKWLEWLQERVQAVSLGNTRLESVDTADFPVQIKSPAVAYLRLRTSDAEQFVAIGPFHPPVQMF